MEEIITKILEIIEDYRKDDFDFSMPEIDEKHIIKWVEQFDEGDREFILAELLHLLLYDAQIGRWHVQDNFSEKYFSLSPYNYVANNPISYTDPTGDTIRYNFENAQALIGFIGKLLQFSAENLNGQFRFTLTKNGNEDGYNYTLGLQATKNGGDKSKLSKEGGEFLSAMEGYINSKTVLKQTIVYNNPEFGIIDATDNRLDIGSVSAFDRQKGGGTGACAFIHETDEQFTKAKRGFGPGDPKWIKSILNPSKASNIAYGGHDKAITVEEKVGGYTRTDNGEKVIYTYPEGKRVTLTYGFDKKNRLIINKTYD